MIKFRHITLASKFYTTKFSANRQNTEYTVGNRTDQVVQGIPSVLYDEVVFCKELKIIYTHGAFYETSTNVLYYPGQSSINNNPRTSASPSIGPVIPNPQEQVNESSEDNEPVNELQPIVGNISSILTMTEEQYSALEEKDEKTMYIII